MPAEAHLAEAAFYLVTGFFEGQIPLLGSKQWLQVGPQLPGNNLMASGRRMNAIG